MFTGMTAIHRAAAVGNTSVLNMLINFYPEVDLSIRICKNYLTPLHLAAAEGQTPMVSFLAANGAKVRNLHSWTSGLKQIFFDSVSHDTIKNLLQKSLQRKYSFVLAKQVKLIKFIIKSIDNA